MGNQTKIEMIYLRRRCYLVGQGVGSHPLGRQENSSPPFPALPLPDDDQQRSSHVCQLIHAANITQDRYRRQYARFRRDRRVLSAYTRTTCSRALGNDMINCFELDFQPQTLKTD